MLHPVDSGRLSGRGHRRSASLAGLHVARKALGAIRRRGRAPSTVSVPTDPLDRVDVSAHNAGATPPTFDRLVSQVVSAAQFAHDDFERLRQVLFPHRVVLPLGQAGEAPHRKLWEYVYVLRAAEQHGLLEPGRRALGFGVGREPIPAALARYGLSVVATDLANEADEPDNWAATDQRASDLSMLSMPDIVSDDVLAERVALRHVDMTVIPDDLGEFDFVWSCCAFEHLGSREAGLEFVVRTLRLLRPGGVSVHTTELELTPRDGTAEYGNIVVYRTSDLDALVEQVRVSGFEVESNWYVSLDTSVDRLIAQPPYEVAHLKLTIGESVSTSVGLLIRRPRLPA